MAAPEAPMTTTGPRRTALLWLLCAALGLAALYGRTLWSARTHLLLGEQAAFGQDREGAVREFGRAAREQAPGNVYADRAVVALLEVARDYEEGRRGPVDREAARRAYMTVRAALLGARHLRTPHSWALQQANQRIAALWIGPDQSDPAAAQAEHLRKLAPEAVPLAAPGFSLLACLGAALLVGGAAAFIARGLDREGRRVPGALRYVAVAAVGAAILLLGLWKA